MWLIWKYSSTFNVGMGQVQNGLLYLKHKSSSVRKHSKVRQRVIDKNGCYSIVENAPKVLLGHTKAEKIKQEKRLDFVLLLSSYDVHKLCPYQTNALLPQMCLSSLKLRASHDWKATQPQTCIQPQKSRKCGLSSDNNGSLFYWQCLCSGHKLQVHVESF